MESDFLDRVFIYLFIYVFIYLFIIYLFIHSFIYLFIYLFIGQEIINSKPNKRLFQIKTFLQI